MTFDPGAVPPAADPLADPAEADLKRRLEAARALFDGIGPPSAANLERFLGDDALEAAALLRKHDRPRHWKLTEALRPHKILRQWQGAVGAAAQEIAEGERVIAEKVRIVALGVELLELWHDGSDAWCWPKERGAACCWRLPSSEAKRFLLAAYGARNQMALEDGSKVPMAPGRQAVAEAFDQLEALAHGAPRRPKPALRVAGDAARLVLDLCRDDYTVAEVTPAGWQLVKPSPLALRRGEGMQPLPEPVEFAGEALTELRTLLGFDGEEHAAFWTLYVSYMFAALRPVPPYFVLAVAGEQGTGKTTTVKLLRLAVDPHETDTQPKPRSEDDLFVNADGQWLTIYDNLSSLNQHYSDAFCRISTGSGYSKRKLYSDRDTARFQVARPQIITAIVDVVAAPDLLDRSLLAAMPELAGYRAEEELLEEVAALMPRVLGQLLDAAAVALRDQRAVKLSATPRMVGPTRWIEAGAEVLGLEPGAFLQAYLDSQARAAEMALEASLIGAPLRDMLAYWEGCARLATEAQPYAGPVGFKGSAKELLSALTDYMSGKPRGQGWPNTPRGMSGALRRIAPALRKLGYRVEFGRAGDAAGTRTIVIDTPNSSAVRSAHDTHHRQNRQSGDFPKRSDGSDGSDGEKHTQTNAGQSSEGEALAAAAHTATASSCAARSAHNANERQNRQDRQNGGIEDILSDGSDGSHGEKHTQTNAGHRGARDVAESIRACSYCRGPIRSDDVVMAKNGATLHHRCVDAWVRGAPAPQPEEQPVPQPGNSFLDNLRAARMACGSGPAAFTPSEGMRIRTARERLGWSQQRLAREAGTFQGAISNLECDKRVNAEVRARVLDKLGLENSD